MVRIVAPGGWGARDTKEGVFWPLYVLYLELSGGDTHVFICKNPSKLYA